MTFSEAVGMVVRLSIPGQPQAQQRHRTTKSGHTYTPEQTTNKRAQVQERFAALYPQWIPWECALAIRLDTWQTIPSSWSKRRQEMARKGEKRPKKKPDWSNCLKLVEDALNGIAYKDDKQLVHHEGDKRYDDGNGPRMEVTIWIIGE